MDVHFSIPPQNCDSLIWNQHQLQLVVSLLQLYLCTQLKLPAVQKSAILHVTIPHANLCSQGFYLPCNQRRSWIRSLKLWVQAHVLAITHTCQIESGYSATWSWTESWAGRQQTLQLMLHTTPLQYLPSTALFPREHLSIFCLLCKRRSCICFKALKWPHTRLTCACFINGTELISHCILLMQLDGRGWDWLQCLPGHTSRINPLGKTLQDVHAEIQILGDGKNVSCSCSFACCPSSNGSGRGGRVILLILQLPRHQGGFLPCKPPDYLDRLRGI